MRKVHKLWSEDWALTECMKLAYGSDESDWAKVTCKRCLAKRPKRGGGG